MKLTFNKLAATAGVAVALLILIIAWHERGIDLARAQAEISAQKQLAKGLEDQARALEQREQSREAETAHQLESMRALVAKVKTPEQIVKWLPAQIPTPQPFTFKLPEATPDNPTPAATAEIPQADLPAMRDFVEQCQECDVRVHALEQDTASKDERLKLAGQQLVATERERDAALRAAKGGGIWTRVKRNAKWFALGAAAGWAAFYVHERTH